MEALLGKQLLSHTESGAVATAQALDGKKFVMLYFSAHW
jgi:hypothetical protein